MRTREESGLFGWVKSQVSTLRRRQSSLSPQRPRRRALVVERLESRELLSVATLSQTWKEFDFVGNGTFSGSFKSDVTKGYTANLVGPITVTGSVDYASSTTGSGTERVDGKLSASIRGYNNNQPFLTMDISTPAGKTGDIVDNNGNVTIAVPDQTNSTGGPMVLSGKFNTKDFTVSASTTFTALGGPGSGTWRGTLVPTAPVPSFDVTVTPTWDPIATKLGTVDVNIAVAGPVQKAATRSTAVATVNLYWADGTGKRLATLKDKIPILWNQAGGSYEISALSTPPAHSTQLLLVTTFGKQTRTTSLQLPPRPVLTITSVSVAPPATGTVDAVFTVTLTGTSAFPVTVKYKTVNDTAKTGDDYTSKTGTLTFQPGVTTQQITVKVKRDKTIGTEQFFMQMSLPTLATLTADGRGVGTIIVA